jgi:hypothetical protein
MFNRNVYDKIILSPPTKGMNQNISVDKLTRDYSYLLENIIPLPLGRGEVRFGNLLLKELPDDGLNYKILKMFPYEKSNANKQILAYTRYDKHILDVIDFVILNPTTFTIEHAENIKFEVDTPLKIELSYNGVRILTTYIKSFSYDSGLGFYTIEIKHPILSVDSEILNIFNTRGKIFCYDFESDTISDLGKDDLAVGCIPRYVNFQQFLVFCNGIDPLYQWDGNSIELVVDYVKEQANSFNRIDDTSFSFTVNESFIQDKYNPSIYDGQSLIQLSIDDVIIDLTVNTILKVDDIVTITTNEEIPEFTGENTVELYYRDFPPTFNFMYVAHDRIFALGAGAAGINYRNSNEAFKVYYCYRPNSVTNWFNENTKTVPSEDLSDKHGVPDNLEAITLINEYLAFIGRKKTQIWTGKDPTTADFKFSAIIDGGCIHGDLVIGLPNDTIFIGQSGIQSFSTLNAARQFAATPYDQIDPLAKEFLNDVMSSNEKYRASTAFKHKNGPFCGFKLAFNPVIIGLYNTSIYSWTTFSGDFTLDNSFLSDLDESLYMCIEDGIYYYGDGSQGAKVYGDRNNTIPIRFIWSNYYIVRNNNIFNNYRYEIQAVYTSNFLLSNDNNLNVSVSGDLRKSFDIQNKYIFQNKGDLLGTIPLLATADNPNHPPPNSIGFRLDKPYTFPQQKLKFSSSEFWINISGRVINGPFVLRKLILYGNLGAS